MGEAGTMASNYSLQVDMKSNEIRSILIPRRNVVGESFLTIERNLKKLRSIGLGSPQGNPIDQATSPPEKSCRLT